MLVVGILFIKDGSTLLAWNPRPASFPVLPHAIGINARSSLVYDEPPSTVKSGQVLSFLSVISSIYGRSASFGS